jgi:hypothetical protein
MSEHHSCCPEAQLTILMKRTGLKENLTHLALSGRKQFENAENNSGKVQMSKSMNKALPLPGHHTIKVLSLRGIIVDSTLLSQFIKGGTAMCVLDVSTIGHPDVQTGNILHDKSNQCSWVDICQSVSLSSTIEVLCFRDDISNSNLLAEGLGLIQDHRTLKKISLHLGRLEGIDKCAAVLSNLNRVNRIQNIEFWDYSNESSGFPKPPKFGPTSVWNDICINIKKNTSLVNLNVQVKQTKKQYVKKEYLDNQGTRCSVSVPAEFAWVDHERFLYEEVATYLRYVLDRNRVGPMSSHDLLTNRQKVLEILSEYGGTTSAYDYLRNSGWLFKERI